MPSGYPQSGVTKPMNLAIIAGGGSLPERLVRHCEEHGIRHLIVAFDGHTEPDLLAGRPHYLTRLGAAGQTIRKLKDEGFYDLVLIGKIQRPHFREIRPDLYTATFLAKAGLRALGDDGLLKAIKGELAREGFTIHGIQHFLPQITMPDGAVGAILPEPDDLRDIGIGMRAAHTLGTLDIGQAVIVHDGLVLGVEGAEGTDELIRRCAGYRRTQRGGILVKACKPQQDKDLDLPTIGVRTVDLCAEHGYRGIAAQAGNALVADIEGVGKAADRHGLFVYGFTSHE